MTDILNGVDLVQRGKHKYFEIKWGSELEIRFFSFLMCYSR